MNIKQHLTAKLYIFISLMYILLYISHTKAVQKIVKRKGIVHFKRYLTYERK